MPALINAINLSFDQQLGPRVQMILVLRAVLCSLSTEAKVMLELRNVANSDMVCDIFITDFSSQMVITDFFLFVLVEIEIET